MDGLWLGTNEGDAFLLTAPCKISIFREKPVARMDAVCTLFPAQ